MVRRQTRVFFLHHSRPSDASLVRDLYEHCPPDIIKGRAAPPWSEIGPAAVTWMEKRGWRGQNSRGYIEPDLMGETPLSAPFLIQPGSRWDLDGEGKFHAPLLERDPRPCFATTSSEGYPDETPFAEWFLRKASCPIPLLSPDFGYADLARHAVGKMGDDPREKAWPVLLYGQKLIERFGRDALLSAPVWKVEERPDGLVWLQVLENPFVTKKKDLLPLAKHLGLEVPR